MTSPRHRFPLPILLLACPFLWLALPSNARAAATPMNIEQSFDVDALGNASLQIHMKLTAAQYQQWKGRYGQNPSLLKRDMSKLLSPYDIRDFNVEQKDMERHIIVSLKARGVVRYKGRGLYEMDIPKAWQGGRRIGSEYEFHYTESGGPDSIMHNTVRVKLPISAYDFGENLAEQGDKIISYHMPSQSYGRSPLLLIAAAVLIIGGLALTAVAFVLPKGSA